MGKIICQGCQKLLASKTKKDYPRNNILEATLATFAMTGCKFRGKGCKVVDDLENITKHEENYCQFRTILCPHAFCEKWILFKDFAEHLEKHDYYHNQHDDYFYLDCKGSTYTFKVDMININDLNKSQMRWILGFPRNDRIFLLMISSTQVPGTFLMESLQLWVQYVGGRDISKRFNSKIQIGNQTHGKYIYDGPIKCIDDSKEEIVKSGFGLVVECEKIKNYVKDGEFEGEFEVEVILEELNPNPEDFVFEHEIKIEVT